MKICTCNNCGGVFEDMNPQTGSNDYPSIDVKPLERKFVELRKPELDYWACPDCLTDGFLQDGVNYESLIRIDVLILKKKLGEDCDEEGSAFIKGWLRETIIQPETRDVQRLEDIQFLFPLEYGEHLDEEKGEWEPPDPETRVFRAMEGGTDGG